MKKKIFKIEGMHCASCAQSVEKALNSIEGVKAMVNPGTEEAHVEFDPSRVTEQDLNEAVKKAGYHIKTEEKTITFPVTGMHCASCTQTIQKALERQDGVAEAHVNLSTEKATVRYLPKEIIPADLFRAVEGAGYEVPASTMAGDTLQGEVQEVEEAKRKAYLAWALTVPIIVWMIPEMFWGWDIGGALAYNAGMVVLALPILFYAGRETYASAARSFLNLSPNMDALIMLGTLSALATGVAASFHQLGYGPDILNYGGVAGMIMAFHLTGRYVENRSKGRASQAIKKLMTLEAKTARVLRDGQEEEVPVDRIEPGDVMVIRPGEKVPTDGVVAEGESSVDESIATGESMPVSKTQGDEVIGATINKEGSLQVRATRVGKDTFLSQVIRMVEEAQASSVPIQAYADRVTSYFVPAIIGIAVAAFLSWLAFPDAFHSVVVMARPYLPWVQPGLGKLSLAIYAAVATLVIACPCALGLATPTALMVGSGRGAENGVLIRHGEAIQTMKEVTVIVLDKTGTITEGQPGVTDVIGSDEALTYAASAEQRSEHPLAAAIVRDARRRDVTLREPGHFESVTGGGVKASVDGHEVIVGAPELMKNGPGMEEEFKRLQQEAKTAVLVSIDGTVKAVVGIADQVKENARQVVAALREEGLEPAMLTGDNEQTARAIAQQVEIKRVMAKVMPDEKAAEIKRLQRQGEVVAMVGDGINDAPALEQADVGIAMGKGTDIAIESGDIVLVKGDLSSIVKAVRLSRATFSKIKQNLIWAFAYNLVAIPLAFTGLLHPLIAEAAMAFSSVNVVTNSLRLKKVDIG